MATDKITAMKRNENHNVLAQPAQQRNIYFT